MSPRRPIHGDDIWEILFTSGTTAMPKGVMESHTTVTLAAHGFALTLTRGLRFESDLRVATFLPMMYHVGHYVFALRPSSRAAPSCSDAARSGGDRAAIERRTRDGARGRALRRCSGRSSADSDDEPTRRLRA